LRTRRGTHPPIHLQVDDVRDRFKELERLRDNSWVEPEVIKVCRYSCCHKLTRKRQSTWLSISSFYLSFALKTTRIPYGDRAAYAMKSNCLDVIGSVP
jgi:hypothetical protein